MDDEIFAIEKKFPHRKYTLKDVLTIAFRRRSLLLICVLATISATVWSAWQLPRFKGQAKLLVMRQRADPVVSPSQENTLAVSAPPVVTDEELKSEAELLSSYDLARDVARKIPAEHGGARSPLAYLTFWKRWFSTPEEREAALINRLVQNLDVEVAKGSNIINLQFKSRDPQFAKAVLDRFLELYLQRHKTVHRPAGQYEFFEQQTEQYQNNLRQAESALSQFPEKYKAVSPAADRDIALQKLNDFKYTLRQTEASASDAAQRIQNLEAQQNSSPARITTQLKRADNPELLQQLKSGLLNLELKRSDLLAKFQPDYPPVQEVEQQITKTRTAIEAQEAQPVKETTTDVDPTHTWIEGELAKARSELAGLRASESSVRLAITAYEDSVRDLDQKAIIYHDLQRNASAEEGKYLMYLRKREEARVADVLDADRLFNVVVAEPPTVPALPAPSGLTFAIVMFCGMSFVSCLLFWAVEYFDNTLTTATEIEAFLNLPVLAAVPAQLGSPGRRRIPLISRPSPILNLGSTNSSTKYSSSAAPEERI